MFANRVSCFIGSNHQATARKTVTILPPPQAFLRLSVDWGTREHARRMMGTSVERGQGVMGRKRRERGESLRSFSPLHHSLRPRLP